MGKSKENSRAYRIVLSGYQEIQLVNSSRLVPFLGVLALMGKAAIIFVTSVCPYGTARLPLDFRRFDYSKFVEDFQDLLKCDNKGLFAC